MHKASTEDVDRLSVSRKEGERGLTCIEDDVDTSIQWFEDYIEKHDGGMITTIKNYMDKKMENRMTITWKQKWEEKQLYGCFKRLINNFSHEKTLTWLRKGYFTRETESLLRAAQNNAIRTNRIKAIRDKTQQNSKCSLCGDKNDTINHIISELSKLVQKEYKTRHYWVGKVIYWDMWKKFKFDHTKK